MRSRTPTLVEPLVLLCIGLGFVGWSAYFIYLSSSVAVDGQRYYSLFDDGMISMRYAWNLAHGQGLVWNPGEYVEGYTNLLMVLVMAVFTAVMSKPHAVLAVQVLGIATTLLAAYLAMRIFTMVTAVEDRTVLAVGRVCVFVLTLTYYPLLYWSLLGMETGLLTVLVCAGVFFAARYLRRYRPGDLYLTAIVMGLAYLTRPDSAVFAVMLFGFMGLRLASKLSPAKAVSLLAVPVACYAAFPLAQLVFRSFYYGELLPNTYVLKIQDFPLSVRLEGGLGFVTPYLLQTLLVFVVIACALVVRQNAYVLLFVGLTAVAVAYQIYVGGDPWPLWRIMAPTMPLLFVAFVESVASLWAFVRVRLQLGTPGAARYVTSAGLIGTVLVGLLVLNYPFRQELRFRAPAFAVGANRANINTAVALNNVTTDSASLGIFWAGTIPYYADRHAIDYLGKSDPHVARLQPDLSGAISWSGMRSVPGHNKYDLEYSIVGLQPTFTQALKWGPGERREADVSAWGAEHYVQARYRGVPVLLWKGSPAVRWEHLDPGSY